MLAEYMRGQLWPSLNGHGSELSIPTCVRDYIRLITHLLQSTRQGLELLQLASVQIALLEQGEQGKGAATEVKDTVSVNAPILRLIPVPQHRKGGFEILG